MATRRNRIVQKPPPARDAVKVSLDFTLRLNRELRTIPFTTEHQQRIIYAAVDAAYKALGAEPPAHEEPKRLTHDRFFVLADNGVDDQLKEGPVTVVASLGDSLTVRLVKGPKQQ